MSLGYKKEGLLNRHNALHRHSEAACIAESQALHGLFTLRQTFSDESPHYQDKGSMENLMFSETRILQTCAVKSDVELIPIASGDYVPDDRVKTALKLYKYQWDLIHNPQRVWFSWLQEEGEGEMITNLVENIRNTNLQGRNKLLISKSFKEKESIDLIIKVPDKPIALETQIKTYNISINTKKFKKEIIKDEIWLSFSNFDDNEQIGAIVIIKDRSKEQEIFGYLGLLDLYVKGDVEYQDDKIIAYISEEPKMPNIELEFNNPGGQETTFSYAISYDLKYKYEGVEYTFKDQYTTQDIKAVGNKYSIQWGSIFQGGDMRIKWKIQNQDKEQKIMIRGRNPEVGEVKQYGNTIGANKYWFFWDIIGRESSHRQFMDQGEYKYIENKVYDFSSHKKEQKGLPLWGGPRGFGFAQLDNWGSKSNPKYCSTIQRWNWKENIKGAVDVIESKLNEVKNNEKLNRIVDLIEIKQDSVQMDDLVIGNVTFTLANSPLFPEWDIKRPLPAGKRSIFDAHLIKYYNGGQLIKDIIEVKEATLNAGTNKKKEKVYYKVIIEGTKYLNDIYQNK